MPTHVQIIAPIQKAVVIKEMFVQRYIFRGGPMAPQTPGCIFRSQVVCVFSGCIKYNLYEPSASPGTSPVGVDQTSWTQISRTLKISSSHGFAHLQHIGVFILTRGELHQALQQRSLLLLHQRVLLHPAHQLGRVIRKSPKDIVRLTLHHLQRV